jgi:hypothetical protein
MPRPSNPKASYVNNIQFLDNPQFGLLVLPFIRVGRSMSRTLQSPRHVSLRALLVESRKTAGLSQAAVAAKLGRYQSFIANVESGQRRVDLVEFIELSEVIGFDPCKALRRVARSKKR